MANRVYIGVDLQEGFRCDEMVSDEYVRHVSAFVRSLPPEKVILTKFINHPDSAFVRFRQWDEMMQGDEATKLFGDLEDGDFRVIEKSGYSDLVPAVLEVIHAQEASEVVIFGVDTEQCVLKTALDVFEAGLRPIVLSDMCTSSYGKKWHDTGVELLGILLGSEQVTTADMMPLRA